MAPLRFRWYPPTALSRWWLPWIHRACDEWHNPSLEIVIPPFGSIVIWRLRNGDEQGQEHPSLWTRGYGWEGELRESCPVCTQMGRELGENTETVID